MTKIKIDGWKLVMLFVLGDEKWWLLHGEKSGSRMGAELGERVGWNLGVDVYLTPNLFY